MSCCSRWLAALLYDHEKDDIVQLDELDPGAFERIIAYAYGEPLDVPLEDAGKLITVLRTLEMEELESRCWDYLIQHVNEDNCTKLHVLADEFDCDALKSHAWSFLTEYNPEYAFPPEQIMPEEDPAAQEQMLMEMYEKVMVQKYRVDPYTYDPRFGGDPGFLQSRDGPKLQRIMDEAMMLAQQAVAQQDTRQMRQPPQQQRVRDPKTGQVVLMPAQPPPQKDSDKPSVAKEVVNSWKARLQDVWEKCQPEPNEDENEDEEYGDEEEYHEEYDEEDGEEGDEDEEDEQDSPRQQPQQHGRQPPPNPRRQQQQQQQRGRQPTPPSSGGARQPQQQGGAPPPPPPSRGQKPPSPAGGDNKLRSPGFDYEAYILEFYTKFNPDGIRNIFNILKGFEDHDVMLIKLFEKYKQPFEKLPTKRSRQIGRRVQREGWDVITKSAEQASEAGSSAGS
mmetsp:Transcript_10027/g.21147  ORF Transcript_10027/g.21147 Transcript_10027/m.21147 type:complete len:449 (-) Transcript_10027:291-1637(-)